MKRQNVSISHLQTVVAILVVSYCFLALFRMCFMGGPALSSEESLLVYTFNMEALDMWALGQHSLQCEQGPYMTYTGYWGQYDGNRLPGSCVLGLFTNSVPCIK